MKKEYRVLAVFIIMLSAITLQQTQLIPQKAQAETKYSILTQNNLQKEAIRAYIKQVFTTCSDNALLYLSQTNSIYNTKQIRHNYIGNTFIYDSSYVGLFSVNDSLADTQTYTLEQLLDYKINTQIAYQQYVKNDYSFNGNGCYNK
jgi:hypothetical protein